MPSVNLQDPTLQLLGAALSRIEALEVRVNVQDKRIDRLEEDLADVHRKLNAHLHAPQMHEASAGPALKLWPPLL